MEKSVNKIVENNLCSGCGMCTAVCPRKAVKMHRCKAGFLIASVEDHLCIDCGACLTMCPSAGTENYAIGKVEELESIKEVYIGSATDTRIRNNGQSGGFTTALNKYLLESGEIDAAAIVGSVKDSLDTNIVYVDDPSKLGNYQGSYYVQTPMCQAVTTKLKVSVTLLGCQSQAISLYEKSKSNNIEYKLGLICSGCYSFAQTEQILKKSKVKNPSNIRYKDKRYGKWPGNIVVKGDCKPTELPANIRIDGKEVYLNFRCFLCADKFNRNCDVVCGDPWGMDNYHTSDGFNVVIARTEKGQQLLYNAEKNGYIQLKKIDKQELIDAHQYQKVLDKVAMTHFISREIGQLEPYRSESYNFAEHEVIPSRSINSKYNFTRNVMKHRDSIISKVLFAAKYGKLALSNYISKWRPHK